MISEKLIGFMLRNEIISYDDQEIYLYGLQQGLIILGNLLTVVIIAYYFNSVFECVIFLISYIPLRSYAGGYHTKNSLSCYMFSIIMIFIFIFSTKFFFWNGLGLAGITLVSALIITLLAPVEDFNKRLNKYERHIYRIITYIILWVLMGMNLFFWILEYEKVSVSLTLSIAISACMLAGGKVKNQKEIADKRGIGEIDRIK